MGREGRIDVTAIVESIRNKIERRSAGRPRTPPFDPQLSADVASLRQSTDLYHLPLVSARGFRASAMGLARRAIRRLLLPWITRQSGYNVINVHVVDSLRDQMELLAYHQALSTEDLLDAQSRFVDALCARLNAAVPDSLREDIAAIQAEILGLKGNLVALQSNISLTQDSRALGAEARKPTQVTKPALDHKRQQRYLPYFQDSKRVVDIRCGRGEFLELLRAASVEAEGIDADRDMVLCCRDKGLHVTQGDPLSWLDQQPDDSLGGVFGAHVIQHMSPDQVIRLVNLCQRKLRRGSYLILESEHPTSLWALTSLSIDFNHPRAIHPEAIRFLLESLSFAAVEVRYSGFVPRSLQMLPDTAASDQVPPDVNEAIRTLNSFLYGSMDYAVLGRRPVTAVE